MANLSTIDLSRQFEHFAIYEARDVSPLYERLCHAIAGDDEILALAAEAASRPVPNLLLGAVQYLLRHETAHPLRAFYPTLGGPPVRVGDPVALFHDFCLERAGTIRELLRTRRVQTNEVRRCALLLPAFARVAEQVGQRPLALVEIGTSAGFNLLWDHYAYDYGTGRSYGDPPAPLRLACSLRGLARPPFPERMPRVASRLGIDLQPVDVHDPDAVDWLRALIWPEQTERLVRLERAVEVVRRERPRLVGGDAILVLPEMLRQVPEDVPLCLYHTFTVNQFDRDTRDRFDALLDEYGATHTLHCISIAGASDGKTELRLLAYDHGAKQERVLAHCEPHGEWIEWLDRNSGDFIIPPVPG